MFLTLTRRYDGGTRPVIIDTAGARFEQHTPGTAVIDHHGRITVAQPLDLITAALAGNVSDPYTDKPTHLDLTATSVLDIEGRDRMRPGHRRYWTAPDGAWAAARAAHRSYTGGGMYGDGPEFPEHDVTQPGAVIASGRTYTVTTTTH